MNKKILLDLHAIIQKQVTEENFSGNGINTICAEYLAKALEDPDCKYKGEDW